MLGRLPPWLRVTLGGGGLFAVSFVLGWLSTDQFRAFGGNASEATLARMRASPRFVEDHFENAEPTTLMVGSSWGSLRHWLLGSEMRTPLCPLPLFPGAARRLRIPPESGLRLTWLGHSTTLIEIDGTTILADPMWSERASPSTWVGPRRFHPPPLALADLPRLDAVIVSHEHYDHLDMVTVRTLALRGVTFHVPLGAGGHLAAWGVAEAQIHEYDAWERTTLATGLRLISTPARHFNGRGVPGRIGALWTSWTLVGPQHRVFLSGDSGLTEAFKDIAAREGPFDVALIEVGQYDPTWGQIHLGPAGALDAYAMLGAKKLLPIHWGTFQLAYHAWSEPAETLSRRAEEVGVSLLTPLLGEPIEPTLNPATARWWRTLPPMTEGCPR